MAFELREVSLPLDYSDTDLAGIVAGLLCLDAAAILRPRLLRRAVDARKKPRVRWVATVAFEVADEQGLLEKQSGNQRLRRQAPVASGTVSSPSRPEPVLVVGMGPAGLFAAWQLARHKVPVVLIDRGDPIEKRIKRVQQFWNTGKLDPQSNVQFGEGGAGTFSDGKLTTRVSHPGTRLVLKTLVECGAPEEILRDAKPHVGTDRLRLVLVRLRQQLQELGVEFRYRCRLTDFSSRSGAVVSVRLNATEDLDCRRLLLAPGHSARDTYQMLADRGVQLEAKPFAVGLRVEHPTGLIDAIQYGQRPRHPALPPADYRLAWNDPQSGRGVYSFCMCPGGEVVNSSSEADGLTVNGMSSLGRNLPRSNSALVVAVGPDDFSEGGALAGIAFQRRLETAAFKAGGGDFSAPAENLLHFLGRGDGPIDCSCRPGVRAADLADLLPAVVTEGLRSALPQFERRMRGFITREAVLVGVESRTSAPVRILRGADGASVSHPGLYPVGEGAGYAGGIMSAALDGLQAAERIMQTMMASQKIRTPVL